LHPVLVSPDGLEPSVSAEEANLDGLMPGA